MAITAVTPVSGSTIQNGATCSFTINDTYTSLIIKVQTSTALVKAYDTALGGAQAGFTVLVVDNGATDTFTVSRDAGWDISPQLIYVIENETGVEATTTISYTLTSELAYPQGSQPYNQTGGVAGYVTSFNTRTGAVLPAANDYAHDQLSGLADDDHTQYAQTALTGAGAPGVATGNGKRLGTCYIDTTADWAYFLADNTSGANVWASAGAVTSVFGRTGAVVAVVGDYSDNKISVSGVIGTPTNNLQSEVHDVTGSPSVVNGGGTIVNDLDGTITVSSGQGFIRASNSDTAPLLSFDFAPEAGANVNLTDAAMNYIYVEYNAGAPRTIATTTERTDLNTNLLLGTVYRSGTTLHITETHTPSGNVAKKVVKRSLDIDGLKRATGSMISDAGTRKFAITAGTWWIGLSEQTIAAFDSSGADRFTYYYRNGAGGWSTQTTQSQISVTNYDDGDGILGVLSVNRYGVHWVYRGVDGDCYVVYGRGDYTLNQAEAATPPADVPPHFEEQHTAIVGKIIAQQGAATLTSVLSPFTTTFGVSGATDHGTLAGLGDDDHTQYAQTALSGAGVPGVATGNGYRIGTIYVDTTADQAYVLTDNTGGANVWTRGDVLGPSSSTDNAIVRFDLATGKLIQDSANSTLGDNSDLALNGTSAEVMMAEKAAASDPGAGKGRFWVKNTAPAEAHFVDDTNVDHVLNHDQINLQLGGRFVASANAIWYGPTGQAYWDMVSNYSSNYGVATDPALASIPSNVQPLILRAGTITNIYTYYSVAVTTATGRIRLYKISGISSGSASYTMTQVGSDITLSVASANVYISDQTGLNVSVSRGDRLLAFIQFDTNFSSGYFTMGIGGRFT